METYKATVHNSGAHIGIVQILFLLVDETTVVQETQHFNMVSPQGTDNSTVHKSSECDSHSRGDHWANY